MKIPMQLLSGTGKLIAAALAVGLLLACQSRADETVSDGTVDSFEAALEDTVSNGGGTITVTLPISVTPDSDVSSFDGQSMVVVSGGGISSIFSVTGGGDLELDNFTVSDGMSTNNGGAIYVDSDSSLELSDCIFSNNVALGADGISAPTNSSGGSPLIGGNGGRGTAGQPVSGGAIYSLGTLVISDCQFLTNSAIGGNGGNGAPGVDGTTRGGNGGGGGRGGSASGGGIFSAGSLTISDTTFEINFAQGGSGGSGGSGGGGIVSGLSAGGGVGGDASGAGLYTADTNGAVISACTFYTNVAEGGLSANGGTTSGGNGQSGPRGGNALGGGIDNAGLLAITNSTFFQNVALGGTGGNGGTGAGGGSGGNGGNATGGGLYNTGAVQVVNCTFSMGGAIGGTNGFGGSGVASSGGNGGRGSRRGGNIANVAKKKKGSFLLANSIVGKTLSGPGSFGTIIDGGYNISADKSIPFKPAKKKGTSLINTDPKVGDLADNGGPTETIALPTNSPAVDFINPITTNTPPDVDQRGQSRPIQVFTNDWSDAGAFELNPNEVTILIQPQSTNVLIGSNVTLSVSAQGTPPLFYQWFFNPSNLPPAALTEPSNLLANAVSRTLLISDAQPTNQGFYIVVITNAFNAATSRVANLTVGNITNNAPAITSLTPDQSVLAGTNVTISVTATGTAPLAYQWFFQTSISNSVTTTMLTDGGNISGSTSNTLSITDVQTNNAGGYFVRVTNVAGITNSVLSMLTVTVVSNSAPIITSSNMIPSDGVVAQGSNATLSVTIQSDTPATSFQWFFIPAGTSSPTLVSDGGNISGATTSSLSIMDFDNVQQDDGTYYVVVGNSHGSNMSSDFNLTLGP